MITSTILGIVKFTALILFFGALWIFGIWFLHSRVTFRMFWLLFSAVWTPIVTIIIVITGYTDFGSILMPIPLFLIPVTLMFVLLGIAKAWKMNEKENERMSSLE